MSRPPVRGRARGGSRRSRRPEAPDASRPRQIVMLSASPWTAFGGICSRAANDR